MLLDSKAIPRIEYENGKPTSGFDYAGHGISSRLLEPENLGLVISSADSTHKYMGGIASLLLTHPSDYVCVLEPEALEEDSFLGGLGEEAALRPTMVGINYHGAGSEHCHRIVLQDSSDRAAGQWVLYAPPGSGERRFYRRSYRIKGSELHPFEYGPVNPLKAETKWLYLPDDGRGFSFKRDVVGDFERLGFVFVDEVLDLSPAEGGGLSSRLWEARGESWQNPLNYQA